MRRKGSLQQLFNGGEEKFPNLFEMLNLKMSCAFNPNPTDDVSSEDQTHVILIRRSEEEPPPRLEVRLGVFKKLNRKRHRKQKVQQDEPGRTNQSRQGAEKIPKPGTERKRRWNVKNDELQTQPARRHWEHF